MREKTAEAFRRVYGDTDPDSVRVYFAPGRVNLIGEHTDYNGGHVLPCALQLGTWAAVRPIREPVLRMYSLNFPENGVAEYGLEDFAPLREKEWTAYPKGVMWAFREHGMIMEHGLEIAFGGNLPAGAGLSSSASLEVLTGFFLRDIFGFGADDPKLALLGQYAENHYCGVRCGIMDQFASAMGKKDHAILLNTDTMSYQYVPLELGDCELIITDSGVKHALADSAYNDRRRECEEGLQQLQEHFDIISLCALEAGRLEEAERYIIDPQIRRRVRHAVTENRRTMEAAGLLADHNLEAFGSLMNESHRSLRDDYEVSCPELDILAETAWNLPDVIGSRMTGGGFGGCTVSIVKKTAADQFREIVGRTYRSQTGKACTFHTITPGSGPRRA